MKAPHSFQLAHQQLWLTPLKAIYWENQAALLVSDLHFGKTGHFRKSGIGVPQDLYKEDLQRLFHLVQYFQPRELIIVGDFFHSAYNRETDWFARWRKDHPALECTLVMGNHDILHHTWYEEQAVELVRGTYTKGPFSFMHDWEEEQVPAHNYTFSGHIHPGIRLQGMGKQSLRLPCFYFGKNRAILPAFSAFTGLAIVSPEAGSSIFAIANQQIIHLQ
ncbi:ligase-associated DNA damage response endonuclease PdeM [Flavihumibacter sp. CACIAM 22H1]|uniref:ligase-associated DNA damage response endonuclease PdeM n=1 Tax=Flavihumibacter sp. CACIAM 22H1 TaxID=1812911 RepID=UPI0007A7C5D3|nr:ligase-associated DNA damage response endonuclease PdeM [Flavihumibacter sp. CACIAM 22H1]KYP13518.1 MAG: metallophosphoesterase [Flavihumibacter sp. CACIAM 22H1]